MTPQAETLHFFRSFKCNGCTKCCRDWAVPLGLGEYSALENLLQEKGRATEIQTALKPLLDHPHSSGSINQKPDQSCYFLQADGRCQIQAQYGEEYLPAVCRTYPRLTFALQEETNLKFESVLSMTCPTVRKIIFEDSEIAIDEFPEFKTEIHSLLSGVLTISDEVKKSERITTKAYLRLKNWMSTSLADRAYSIEDHLVYLTTICQHLDGKMKTQILKDTDIEDFLKNLPADRTIAQQKGQPNTILQLQATMSWLRLRGNHPISHPMVFGAINAFLVHENAIDSEDWGSELEKTIRPLLLKHQNALRKLIASRLYFCQSSILYDYPWLSLIRAVQTLGLLKLFIYFQIKKNLTPDRSLLENAIEVVEHCQTHDQNAELEMQKELAKQKIPPQAMLPLIR